MTYYKKVLYKKQCLNFFMCKTWCKQNQEYCRKCAISNRKWQQEKKKVANNAGDAQEHIAL